MRAKTSLVATAYHEAGHAVVARRLNVRILRGGVSIKPDETSRGRACISIALGASPEWGNSDRVRLRAERRALVSLAAMEAQRKYNPRTVRSYHGHQDYQNAREVTSRFVLSDEEGEAYLKLLRIRARQMVSNPAVWPLIQAVANALVERGKLTGTEVDEVIRSAPQQLLPRDPVTAELTLNGKKIAVDYSRPKISDPNTGQPRKIMGGLVPYGEVWRTGANGATTLKTETILDINGTTVPAGTYTLFTIPQPDKWTLIISKKTGEWGIPYPGESEDFARVPMKVEHLSQVVDPFTITLEPPRPNQLPTLGVGGPSTPAQLCLAWENTKACVDLNAK